jgi:hypothetical protein
VRSRRAPTWILAAVATAVIAVLLFLVVVRPFGPARDGDFLSPGELLGAIVVLALGLAAGAAVADRRRLTTDLLMDPTTGLANREGLVR